MATDVFSLRYTLLLALALCAACSSSSSDDDGSGPASISGTVLFLEGTTLVENEPNDAFDQPNPAGQMGEGSTRTIRGDLSEGDGFDGFSLLARERVRVTATLRTAAQGAPDAPYAIGLELAAWDPVQGEFGASSRASGAASTCVFEACGAFDLVVRGTNAPGHYELEVRAEPSASRSSQRGLAADAGFEFTARPEEFAAYLHPALEAKPGQCLVLPRTGADQAAALAALVAHDSRVVSRIPDAAWLVEFDLPAALDRQAQSRATVARMRALGEERAFQYSELNLIRRISGVTVTPNDTFFHLQWHYPLIHLPEAWSVTIGDPSVVVAVIDTGETAHFDLAGQQLLGYDLITDPASAADGDGPDNDPTDEGDGEGVQPSSWHGTHVAGTVSGATDNGTGIAGVTWECKVIHVRVLGKGGGTDFDIANGIRFAAGLPNSSGVLLSERAEILNLSLGGPGPSTTVQSAVTAARAEGCTIFAAAGNSNSGQPFYPAAFDGVISISAVDINSVKAPYSNFHATVDFCAPGGDTSQDLNADGFPDGVLSTLLDSSGFFIYAFYDGTSMACPHAAGVAALMLSTDPGHDLTPNEIEALLLQSAVDLGAPGHDSIYGHGLINAYEAALLAQGGVPAGPVLSVSPAALAFGVAQTSLMVQVTNVGTGLLDVGTITDSTTSPEDWLTVVPGAGNATTDIASLTVTVDRTGLADGTYAGNIEVQSDGGTKNIPITMLVDVNAVPVDVDLFVLAVELDSGRFGTEAQAIVNPTTGLGYALTAMPPGNYVVVCGSDDDDDGFICGDGDFYCGLYPTLNEPEPIAVGEGTAIGNVDFPVGTTSAPLFRGNVPAAGFRLQP